MGAKEPRGFEWDTVSAGSLILSIANTVCRGGRGGSGVVELCGLENTIRTAHHRSGKIFKFFWQVAGRFCE